MLSYLTMFTRHLTTMLGRDERGATMVEYGLMVALIALVVIAGATALGLGINALFNEAADELS